MTKKKEKKIVYEKISSDSSYWDKLKIPDGATHVELELDYSGCYYEGDSPSMIAHFYKEKEE